MHFTMNEWPWTARRGQRCLLGAVVGAVVILSTLSGPLSLAEQPADSSAAAPAARSDTASEASAPQVLPSESSDGKASPVVPGTSPTRLRVVPTGPEESVKSAEPRPTVATTKTRAKPAAASPGVAPRPAAAGAEPSLEPIPDSRSAAPPSVETASFSGVTPGATTVAELDKAWGAPREVRQNEGMMIRRYAIEPFNQIEVMLSGDKVASIVIRLEKAFPAKTVAEQLQLNDIRSVLVSNELGDILGEAFPERGVLFAYEQTHQPGKPSMQVTEIVLEPIGPDPFILRAETNLDRRHALNLKDLDQAIALAPNLARAHWLRARVLAAMGKASEALPAAMRAVELEKDNARYYITLAQILEQASRHDEAIAAAKTAVERSENRPHVRARALCLLGDLAGSGERPDCAAALDHHMEAIKIADPLAVERHPAIRLAAKEVLIDAHLGAATDIAWGQWAEKDKAVERWVQRAGAFAEELIANDGGGNEHRFRVATRALAAYVGVQGKLDPTNWAKEATRVGKEMIDQTDDPIEKRQLQWELGMALFNAVQIYQIRKEDSLALECGERTIENLEAARQDAQADPSRDYLLGRLYFRLGAINALNKKSHHDAVTWFDKAIPLLQTPLPAESASERGRHGETFVSMGVSYWEVNQRDKAIELTNKGLAFMKQAVEGHGMTKSALSVPYDNLAAMQRFLGQEEAANESQKLADDARGLKAAQNSGTANKPDAPVLR